MKKVNDSKRTYMLITIPILALFVCFNTVPLIRGVVYSFTNFKGFGTYDFIGSAITWICSRIPGSAVPTCSPSSLPSWQRS